MPVTEKRAKSGKSKERKVARDKDRDYADDRDDFMILIAFSYSSSWLFLFSVVFIKGVGRVKFENFPISVFRDVNDVNP